MRAKFGDMGRQLRTILPLRPERVSQPCSNSVKGSRCVITGVMSSPADERRHLVPRLVHFAAVDARIVAC